MKPRRSRSSQGALVAVVWLAASAGAAEEPDQAPDDAGDANPVEEVVVTGQRVKNLTRAERLDIYRQLAQGRRLYSDSDFERAFPLLLNTAEHGFKDAQARVGYMYLQGLGDAPRDSTSAVGWLGVAAAGNSSPGIENFFNRVWKRIPDRHVPYFETVVEDYKARFGERPSGVTCDLRRSVGSHFKRLSCYFDDDLTIEQRRLLETMMAEVSAVDPVAGQPALVLPSPFPPLEDSD